MRTVFDPYSFRVREYTDLENSDRLRMSLVHRVKYESTKIRISLVCLEITINYLSFQSPSTFGIVSTYEDVEKMESFEYTCCWTEFSEKKIIINTMNLNNIARILWIVITEWVCPLLIPFYYIIYVSILAVFLHLSAQPSPPRSDLDRTQCARVNTDNTVITSVRENNDPNWRYSRLQKTEFEFSA